METGVTIPAEGMETRFKAVVDYFKSRREAAHIAGISEDMIYKYIGGRASLSLAPAAKLCAKVGVSLDWLVSGRDESGHVASNLAQVADGEGAYEAAFALVPKYDVEASAGGGREVTSEEEVGRFAFRRDWLSERGLRADRLALISARGDSMRPTINAGDTLLIDMGDAPVRDGIYVIRMGGELYVKRIQRLPGGLAKVRSDNQAYEAFEIPLNGSWVAGDGEDVGRDRIVGRVVWIGHVIDD